MAAESSTSSSRSGGLSAESYIGSLISLTSKSEIRYEGVLYSINTEESSIGLRNVRSFGTEGRKKDGPQVPPSDKIYEFILFRGSDIKDLQVKSSPPPPPPVQAAPTLSNDPAIIQSQYARPATASTSFPTAASGSLTELSNQQLGLPSSSFHGAPPPLYQPGGSLGSWGPPPASNSAGSALAMPLYWQGYYGAPNGLPQLPQQSLLRPSPGLSMPSSIQQMQFSGFNPSLPSGASSLPSSNLHDYPSSLVSSNSSSPGLTLTSLPASTMTLNLPPMQPSTSETISSSVMNKARIPTSVLGASLTSVSPITTLDVNAVNVVVPSTSSKPSTLISPILPHPNVSQPVNTVSGTSTPLFETPTHSLVTPGQLMQSGPAIAPSGQSSQMDQKDVEVVRVSPSSEPVAPEAQPPILPLPPPTRAPKPNGAHFQTRQNYRGRGVSGGRGSGISRSATRFTEDFDFMAMNEKFNKDEVWGHLGKSNKSPSKDKAGSENGTDEDDSQDEYDPELPKIDIKPLYNKDDFFDSLSGNAFDNEPNHGRIRYSEQMKLDTETFGEFSRYRGGRGGRGPGRGGRSRGYYGRGGYGYNSYNTGRGRGRGMPSRSY